MAKTKKKTATSRATKKSVPQKPVAVKTLIPEIVEPDEADSDAPLRPEVVENEDWLEAEPIDADSDEILEVPKKTAKKKKTAATKELASTDPIAMYLAEVRKYPLLTREEESKLATQYFETKDPAAAQALVQANLRFVVKIAVEYSKFGARLIDLIQEGNVGLMHAVREFNPYKGVRLITYAVWWIRGYIQEYLMKQYSVVRIGTTHNQRKLFYQLQKQKDALDAMGSEPNIKLLSTRLGIPEDEVEVMAQRMSGRDVSLNMNVDENSKTSLLDLQTNSDQIAMDDRLALEELVSLLREKIDEIRPLLSEREKIILEERLLNDQPLTLQEIGEKHGITREAVRQMEARLLNKIKKVFLNEDQTS